MTDQFAYWREAQKTGSKAQVEDIQSGRYRRRTAEGYRPVAIWQDAENNVNILDGKWHNSDATKDGADQISLFQLRAWPQCEAVTDAAYQEAIKGGDWPDAAPATPLHNQPPESVSAQIDDLRMTAHSIIKGGEAKDQASATKAANIKARLEGLKKQLQAECDEACAPHDIEIKRLKGAVKDEMAQRATVAGRFTERLEIVAMTVANLANHVIGPFLIAERRRQESEIAAGKAEPQRDRRGNAMTTSTKVGAVGATTFLKTVWRAEIEDWPKALAALANHPDIRAEVERIANAAARSKARVPIDGVKFIKEEVAK